MSVVEGGVGAMTRWQREGIAWVQCIEQLVRGLGS